MISKKLFFSVVSFPPFLLTPMQMQQVIPAEPGQPGIILGFL